VEKRRFFDGEWRRTKGRVCEDVCEERENNGLRGNGYKAVGGEVWSKWFSSPNAQT
jgi:hypothetical protein